MKRFHEVGVAQENIVKSPDGEKTYDQLVPGYATMSVANKIGIIYTESSWLILNVIFFTIKEKRKIPENVSLGD